MEVRGTCSALFAFDVGLGIALEEAERRIEAHRETLKGKRRMPRYFQYRPPPLRVTQIGQFFEVGGYRAVDRVELVIFDFGAIAVTYAIPFASSLERLIELSEALYDSQELLVDARHRVELVAAAIQSAIARPLLSEFYESYTLFAVEHGVSGPASELLRGDPGTIARLLRSERGALSTQEIGDATSHAIAYRPDDVVIIDWDAALAVGGDVDEVRAVLEFANVELLEMRHLDQRLDDALDDAYETMSRATWGRSLLPGGPQADRRRIAQMQVDAAILFEGVNNALKLIGDQYLARLYHLASDRFHLAEWDQSILRKLETLDGIYDKISDEAASRRMEVLEWIIIILIAGSIVVPFIVPH